MSGTATRATQALARIGIAFRVHAYEPPERHGAARDERPEYGRDAAAVLGVAEDRIFKTLVAEVDGRLALAVVPVSGTLDLKRLADALGGRRAAMADPSAAQRATGYVVGGISPLGSQRPLPVVLDATATRHPTVFVSAGRRGLQVELAPDDLARAAHATVAPISR